MNKNAIICSITSRVKVKIMFTITREVHARHAQRLQQKLPTSINSISVAQSAIAQTHSLDALIGAHNSCRSVNALLTRKQQELIDAVFHAPLSLQENSVISQCIRCLLPTHEREGSLVTKLLFLLHRAIEQNDRHDIIDTVMCFMMFYQQNNTSMPMRSLSIDYTYKLATQQPNNSITALISICADILTHEDHENILTEFCSLIASDMSNDELNNIEYNFACINIQYRHEVCDVAKRLFVEYRHWRMTEILILLNSIWNHLERDDILQQTLHLVRNIQDHGETAVAIGNYLKHILQTSNRQQFVTLVEQLAQRNAQWDLRKLVFAMTLVRSRHPTIHSHHAERENIMGYLERLSTNISTDPNELFASFYHPMQGLVSTIGALSITDLHQRHEMVQYVVFILPGRVTGYELAAIISVIHDLMIYPRFNIAWACLQHLLTAEFEIQHRIFILNQLVPILHYATSDTDLTTQIRKCVYDMLDKIQPPYIFK